MDSVEHKRIQINRDLDNLAYILDGTFKVPIVGWRFGFDFILGLIPTVGDFATTLVSFYILIAGVRYGVPKITLVRMAINISIDYRPTTLCSSTESNFCPSVFQCSCTAR